LTARPLLEADDGVGVSRFTHQICLPTVCGALRRSICRIPVVRRIHRRGCRCWRRICTVNSTFLAVHNQKVGISVLCRQLRTSQQCEVLCLFPARIGIAVEVNPEYIF
jgi:hypothetical protein